MPLGPVLSADKSDGYSFHYGGLAIQDLADARMLLNLARQRGIGVELPLV